MFTKMKENICSQKEIYENDHGRFIQIVKNWKEFTHPSTGE